jgi:small subunit ribosomal protein S2
LFVGTKRQAQDAIAEEAKRCGCFFVNNRWLGGTLTNFKTIRRSVETLRKYERMAEDGSYEDLTKKEIVLIEKKKNKLNSVLDGIKDMERLPDALFVVDPNRERIAVAEAKILNIPVVAIVDTNCDPDHIDYVIPGNDDAIRAVKLFASKIAECILEGEQLRNAHAEVRENQELTEQQEMIPVDDGTTGAYHFESSRD